MYAMRQSHAFAMLQTITWTFLLNRKIKLTWEKRKIQEIEPARTKVFHCATNLVIILRVLLFIFLYLFIFLFIFIYFFFLYLYFFFIYIIYFYYGAE